MPHVLKPVTIIENDRRSQEMMISTGALKQHHSESSVPKTDLWRMKMLQGNKNERCGVTNLSACMCNGITIKKGSQINYEVTAHVLFYIFLRIKRVSVDCQSSMRHYYVGKQCDNLFIFYGFRFSSRKSDIGLRLSVYLWIKVVIGARNQSLHICKAKWLFVLAWKLL